MIFFIQEKVIAKVIDIDINLLIEKLRNEYKNIEYHRVDIAVNNPKNNNKKSKKQEDNVSKNEDEIKKNNLKNQDMKETNIKNKQSKSEIDEKADKEVVYQVTRCDIAWKASAFFPDDYTNASGSGNFNFSRLEQISGDVSRAIATTDPLKADADFREVYLRECDRLAETLYVSNYRRPEVRRYSFDRSGSEFIMAVPGPADTAVGSRMELNKSWR